MYKGSDMHAGSALDDDNDKTLTGDDAAGAKTTMDIDLEPPNMDDGFGDGVGGGFMGMELSFLFGCESSVVRAWNSSWKQGLSWK